jgi:cobyrinic acid a,c-diamide synthase
VDYDPWQAPFPLDAEVIYFPHFIAELAIDRLMANESFSQGIRQSYAFNKLIFANGASSLLFGQYFTTPDQQKHEGLKFFPFHGSCVSSGNIESRRIEIRGTADSIFNRNEEKMRGYVLEGIQISNPGKLVPTVWSYRDVRRDAELGVSGWVKGYCFVTDLYLELWSNIELVNRWLSLRKREKNG